MIKKDKITACLRMRCCMATALIQKLKLDKGAFLHGEFREPNRKDKVTRFHSASYAR